MEDLSNKTPVSKTNAAIGVPISTDENEKKNNIIPSISIVSPMFRTIFDSLRAQENENESENEKIANRQELTGTDKFLATIIILMFLALPIAIFKITWNNSNEIQCNSNITIPGGNVEIKRWLYSIASLDIISFVTSISSQIIAIYINWQANRCRIGLRNILLILYTLSIISKFICLIVGWIMFLDCETLEPRVINNLMLTTLFLGSFSTSYYEWHHEQLRRESCYARVR